MTRPSYIKAALFGVAMLVWGFWVPLAIASAVSR